MDKNVLERAVFAGGCFWCMQPPFEGLEGVRKVTVGYTGGETKDPTYEEVCSGATGHAEAVEVVFDPKEISYQKLLEIFWRNIDPTTMNRQFADAGTQYRTAVFYDNETQKRLAEESKDELARSGKFRKPIVTELTPGATFYPAEDYHQGYCRLNPAHYAMYRVGSGRAGFLEQVWGQERKGKS